MNHPRNNTFILLCGSKYLCNTEEERQVAAKQLKMLRIPETMMLEGNPNALDTWIESGLLLCSDGSVKDDA